MANSVGYVVCCSWVQQNFEISVYVCHNSLTYHFSAQNQSDKNLSYTVNCYILDNWKRWKASGAMTKICTKCKVTWGHVWFSLNEFLSWKNTVPPTIFWIEWDINNYALLLNKTYFKMCFMALQGHHFQTKLSFMVIFSRSIVGSSSLHQNSY